MHPRLFYTALSLLALGLAAVGCDSATTLLADLGQSGGAPALDAYVSPLPPVATAGVAAGSLGQALSFVAHDGRALPSEWASAQSIKLQYSGTFLPLATGSLGATPSMTAIVPVTLPPPSRPLDNSAATMSFLVNNDHMMLALISFR